MCGQKSNLSDGFGLELVTIYHVRFVVKVLLKCYIGSTSLRKNHYSCIICICTSSKLVYLKVKRKLVVSFQKTKEETKKKKKKKKWCPLIQCAFRKF